MSNTAILTSYMSNFNQFIHSKNPGAMHRDFAIKCMK